jgi:3-dehydroquinate dehydratase type I
VELNPCYPKICLSLTARTVPEMLKRMERGWKETDLLELRLDGMAEVSLKELLAGQQGELLITNRSREEGGAFNGTETERVEALVQAALLGADYVDLEAGSERAHIERLKKKLGVRKRKTRLVLSTHYFQKTPALKVLQKRMEDGAALGADFVKIVPYARTMADNLTIFRLLGYAEKKQIPVIAFCMGEQGKASRLLAPLFGSCWTYAAMARGQEAAPGQMTVREMKQLYRTLKRK